MPIRCLNCDDADLAPSMVQLQGEVRGETYSVTMLGLSCPRCGYKTIEGAAMPEYRRLLADQYRAAHALLTSEQIRALRKSFGETQEQFAKRIGFGIASVKRWEMEESR